MSSNSLRTAIVYLSLGSNLGDREENIATALRYLSEKVKIEKTSSLYETDPMYYLEQPTFLNAACRGRTSLSPLELLDFVKVIEESLGRQPSFRNAPRPIDIDILIYDDVVLSNPRLTIPHPRLAERAFVLVPLAEIAPGLVIPGIQKPVTELLKTVEGLSSVRRWEAAEGKRLV